MLAFLLGLSAGGFLGWQAHRYYLRKLWKAIRLIRRKIRGR